MSDGGTHTPRSLSPESSQLFAEGISLVLARWTALQMAIQNEWGGRNTREKAEGLPDSILSWFSTPKDVLENIDDLEDLLDDEMVELVNAELDDGSIEEVAKELVSLHEECLQGKNELLEMLRKSNPGTHALSQTRQIVNENDSSSDDQGSDMDMMSDDPKQGDTFSSGHVQLPLVDEEEWTIVPSRKNKGRRSS